MIRILRRTIYLSAGIFLLISVEMQAQDPVYSQYFITPLQINPALAGTTYEPRLTAVYRLQWPGISAAYNTFSLGYDQFLDKSNLGLGFQLNRDAAGDGALATTRFSTMLSYRLMVGDESYVRGGLEVGLIQKSLNWQKLVFYDAIAESGGVPTPGGSFLPSAEVEPANTKRAYLDIASGILLYNPRYYIGLSLDHLNTPEDRFLASNLENYTDLPLRWTLQGGYRFETRRKNKSQLSNFWSPNLLYTRQASFSQLNAGVYMAVSQFVGGIWFRQSAATSDAIILNLGVRTPQFIIGYSFDYTISGLSVQSGGAHEVAVSYIFTDGRQKRSKLNDCLGLFR